MTAAGLLERFARRAWPPLRTIAYDGWLVGLSDGYTRRANSVHIVGPSELVLDHKIEHCIDVYREERLPPRFKLTERSPDIDALLAARGYQREGDAAVMTMSLPAAIPPQPPVTAASLGTWMSHYGGWTGLTAAQRETGSQIIARIEPKSILATVEIGGRPAAAAMGVAQHGHVGVFHLAVDPGMRGRGLGTALVAGVLAWGEDHGAGTAYLQVMTDNSPAIAFWAQLGFRESYRYWYRSERENDTND